MSMFEIPEVKEDSTPPAPENFTYTPREKKKNGAFVDWFMTALIVLLTVAIIATYFIKFDVNAELDFKSITVNTIWFAIGTFSVGALGKKVSRHKGEKMEEYVKSEEEATEAIKKLCDSEYIARVGEYGEAQTKEAINRYRKNELLCVGISVETFEKEYLGKGVRTLYKDFRKGKLSFIQCKAIWRCNRKKIQAYDPNFITSYHATTEKIQTASGMINVKKLDRSDTIISTLFMIGGASGIGVMFSDVILNFSTEALFEAIIKIIMLGISLGLKTSFGWNLSLMEIRRNKLRASEAQACMEWAKRTPVVEEDETKVETVPCGDMEAVEG